MPRGDTPLAVSPLRTRYITGMASPWCTDRLPSHIQRTAVSTGSVSPPNLTKSRTLTLTLVLGAMGPIHGANPRTARRASYEGVCDTVSRTGW